MSYMETTLLLAKYRFGRHNACDSFLVKIPGAEYAFTSSSHGGCAQILEGAPMRDHADPNPTTLYKIKYNGQDWQGGVLDARHPFNW